MRINFFEVTDVVKYIAFEGSSLTLLGLVKYNADTDSFDMTQLSNVLAGGCNEAKRCLTQHLSALKEIRLACTMIGAGLCSIGFFFTWLRMANRRN